MSEESQELSKDQDVSMVRQSAESLIEHFDSVQIFVTKKSDDGDGYIQIQLGRGNWFTRYGQVKCWIIKEDETTREQSRKDMKEE